MSSDYSPILGFDWWSSLSVIYIIMSNERCLVAIASYALLILSAKNEVLITSKNILKGITASSLGTHGLFSI